MTEKIIMTFIAVTLLAFFLPIGTRIFRKGPNGKRIVPLPLAVFVFVGGTLFYLVLVLSVLIPILRK